jgi:hypothetical protein
MNDTEQKIAELHAWYCQRTRLKTKICFSQQLWFDRLRDYEYDSAKLRGDCELIVRYLQREINRDKRNLGALKLSNFLQPDSFDSDLALATFSHLGRNPRPATVISEQRVGDISRQVERVAAMTVPEPIGPATKKFMDDFHRWRDRRSKKEAAK